MTVSSQTSSITHDCDGVSVDFSAPFYFLRNADLIVSLIPAEGDPVPLALDTDYTVTGAGVAQGGTVHTAVAYPAPMRLIVDRVIPITQNIAYQSNDPFPAKTHELALDKLTMICQMIAGVLGFTPGLPSRVLTLGFLDIDGDGAYRAKHNRIQDLGNPVYPKDAATKQYVDDTAASTNAAWQAGLDVEAVARVAGDAAVRAHSDAEDIRSRHYAEGLLAGAQGGIGYFLQDGEGSVPVTWHSVIRSVFTPAEFDIKGDGSDETAKINKYLAAAATGGWPARFQRGALYRVNGLVMPAGSMFDGYGAEFVSGVATKLDTVISIMDNAEVQDFTLLSVDGEMGSGQIYPGATVRNGRFIADVERDGSFMIHPSAKHIDLYSYNMNYPFIARNWDDPDGGGVGLNGRIKVRNYVRGVRLDGLTRSKIEIDVSGRASTAAKEPGNNGLLINGCQDTVILPSYLADPGEHAVRIGGDINRETKGLRFEYLRIDNTWGCIFKANVSLGTTAYNIDVDVIEATRCGNGSNGRNSELIRTSGCDGIRFGYVRHRNLDSSRQLQCAVQTGRTSNMSIDYIDVDGCGEFVRLNDDMDGPGPIDGFTINGGRVVSNSSAAIQLNVATHSVANVDITASLSGAYEYYAQGHTVNPTVITGPIRFDINVLPGGGTQQRFFSATDNVTCRVRIADTNLVYEGPITQREAGRTVLSVPGFSPANVLQTDRGFLLKSSGVIAAQGAYGAALEFSRLESGRRSAAVAATQTGADAAQTGLTFFAGSSTESSEALLAAWSINHNRAHYPSVDNLFSIGTASNRVSEVFAGTATINTSDENEKEQIGDIPEAVLRAWSRVRYRAFKFRDAIQLKGAEARWHVGLIAQEVKAAFEAEGIDALEWGLLCYDEWEAVAEIRQTIAARAAVLDEEGNEIEPAVEEHEAVIPGRDAGSRYGLRYEECYALEAEYQRARYEALEARVAALEGAA